jgi:hypothetical protein
MKKYDPYKAPDLDEWRDMEEAERISMVQRYHRKAGVELPNEQIHAAIHVIVENQIAEGDQIPVGSTLTRLMSEGLDRHDALHAIGSVLIDLIYGSLKDGSSSEATAAYFAGLSTLTAQGWLDSFKQEQ